MDPTYASLPFTSFDVNKCFFVSAVEHSSTCIHIVFYDTYHPLCGIAGGSTDTTRVLVFRHDNEYMRANCKISNV